MARNKLSARFAETVKKPGRHSDGEGLYLVISATGARKWVFRFVVAGKAYDRGLGSPDAARGGTMRIPLEEARKRATALRAKVASGLKPEAIRLQDEPEPDAPSIPTFGEVADEYITAMKSGFKNSTHVAQWESTLGTIPYTVARVPKDNKAANALYLQSLAELRAKAVDAVTTDDVLAVLKPIWKVVPETAARLRGRIAAVLDAAKAKGLRAGENPARWDGHLDSLLPKRHRLTRGHHAAMPFEELPGFLKALRASPSISGLALEMTILTAARSGEVLGALWSEMDEAKAVWIIPAIRMKGGKEHRVPLTARALEILESVRPFQCGDQVFPGRKEKSPLSIMAMTMHLRRMGQGNYTVHGFRSTFRDYAAESLPFPNEVCEMALAHAVRDRVEAAYRRGDLFEKRRKLMEAWTEYCCGADAMKEVPQDT